ncbi:TPR-like protein [Hymenopellis radicata]|nr:TPR-like protein [Hymenopellis radicata]
MSLDIPSVEKWLLTGTWPANQDESSSTTLKIAKSLVDGEFESVLTSGPAQTLFKHSADIDIDSTSISGLFQSHTSLSDDAAQGELLCLMIAVSCLHAFVQANWTGPDLSITPLKVLTQSSDHTLSLSEDILDQKAIFELAHGGEPAYHLAKHSAFLRIAQILLAQTFTHVATVKWWQLRAQIVHQQVLDEPVYILSDDLGSFASIESLYSSEPELVGRLRLEQGLLQHLFTQDKAAEYFVRAARATGLEYELSGALGKRTKFQQTDLSQLVVLAQSRLSIDDSVTSPAVEQQKEKSVPETLALNDDTLLEHTQFTSSNTDPSNKSILSHLDPSSQPPLHPLDQSILLGMCLNVRNTSPIHGLTSEEMLPYVSRVISHPRNWSVHTMALLLRSRLESSRTRTVERATLQLQALVDQMPTADSTVSERLRYFHEILLPSKWDMEKELAERYISLGVIKSSLEIFERLEMWEEVVKCWVSMEQPEKGLRIVVDLLEGHKLESEAVMKRGKASSGDRRKVLDINREAKLLCLLGDLEPARAVEHYEHAWEVSKHSSGRAMRSLGGYYFARAEYAKAIECLQKTVAINPLLSRSWFILGCSCMRLEDWEGAETHSADVWNNLASMYLRMGTKPKAKSNTDDAEDDPSFAYSTESAKSIPYENKMLAFRALQRGLKHSYDNWRMWSNFMIVAMDVGQLAEACRALGRVVEETVDKTGAKAVDEQVLERLVDGVTRAPSNLEEAVEGGDTQNAAMNPNEGHGLLRSVLDLFERTILPRVSSSRIFRAYAKLLTWQGRWDDALKAHLDSYRSSSAGTMEKGETDVAKWREAIAEVEDIVDVLRNFGPRVDGFKWKLQARSIVRTFIGRTKDYEDEPEWSRLTDLQEEVRKEDQ